MARLPTLFISHGAPTYGLAPGVAGAQLAALGQSLTKPKAVLIVSPHWTTSEVEIGATPQPETIHDFGGFPAELYRLLYPVQGDPQLAAATADLLRSAGWKAALNSGRGLDHGAWIPMRHLFPQADVPTFQVSMPRRLDAAAAYAFGQALAPLSDQGVLIVGSGSLTHNLYEFRSANSDEPAYAREFVAWVRNAVVAGDRALLQRTLEIAPHAQRAHPTAEHFLPLLVAAGAADGIAGISGPVEVLDGGFTHGVLSMESYVFGGQRSENSATTAMEATHV